MTSGVRRFFMLHRVAGLQTRLLWKPRRLARRFHCMAEKFAFGPYTIAQGEVFATSPLSYAFVNLRPVVPGHVLVSTKRVVPRFSELTHAEVSDLWILAQEVGSKIEKHYRAESLTLCIQDGRSAGQTVPHVHVHCLPRKRVDFENNDDVYDRLDTTSTIRAKLDLDIERKDRTQEDMFAEAATLRELFE